MQKNQLRTDAEKAAARTEAWMLRHISEENLYSRKIDDPVKYYKWPMALFARGKKKEARQLLDWINKNCLAENGDYVSNRSGFHKEFHTYSTLWMTLAAIELGETELIEKQLGFILQYHNKTTGGLATFPASPENITEDPVSTAFLGWAACGLKNKELADSIIPFFEKLAAQKMVDNKFWLRMAPDGSLIKTIPE
ncbi:MAG: hypothetical protein LC658_04775, partial [Bacteroidales bacterium]|nr:hypothetical protein [Bacteroidales bacterium]